MMRLIYIFLFLSLTSCIKEDKLRSVEKYILEKSYENTKNILIYGDSNVEVLKKTNRLPNYIYKSFKGKGIKNIPLMDEIDDKIEWVYFCIGTNDGYNPDTNSFKRVYSILKRNYPKAKIYAVSGTHGWGNSKTNLTNYVKYYKEMSRFGFDTIIVPYKMAYFKTSFRAHRRKQNYHYYIIDLIEKMSRLERC